MNVAFVLLVFLSILLAARRRFRPAQPTVRLLLCLASPFVLAGCHDSWNSTSPPAASAAPPAVPAPPPVPGPVSEPAYGYFSGAVDTGVALQYGEVLLTTDDLIRAYVGSPSGNLFDPEDSAQFMGQLRWEGGSAEGTGLIVGQACAGANAGRFCATPAAAEIEIVARASYALAGEIRVSTPAGEETWTLELSWPTSTYLEPATLEFAQGLYTETLAEFALNGDVLFNVDAAGRLFFQGPDSGCVGNGILAPHPDGTVNVYDVVLLVESCDAEAYAIYNGEYSGLATRTVGDEFWGDWLVIWLSAPDGSAAVRALTLWGSRLPE